MIHLLVDSRKPFAAGKAVAQFRIQTLLEIPYSMLHNTIKFCFFLLLFSTVFTIGCSAQTEEQALQSLRQMTKDGKLPAESVVENIERRFAGRQVSALARLLRARIKFENKDFVGAAMLLNTDEIAKKTKLGDYALWLRGRTLQLSGNDAEAMTAYVNLITYHPASLHLDAAKIAWAEASIAYGNSMPVPVTLQSLNDRHDSKALLVTAQALENQGKQADAYRHYRLAYFYGADSDISKTAEAKLITGAQPLTPANSEEAMARAETLFAAKNYVEADKAYAVLDSSFPSAVTPAVSLRRIIASVNARKMPEAQNAFNKIPASAKEKEKAFYELALGYAKNKLWPQARQYAEEMRQKYPNGALTPKAWVDAGYAARDAKNKGEENFFLRTALTVWPNAIEVAGAQFELAWIEHEAKNYARASEMLVDHLARYVHKDTTNRGKAGYWAARNAERAGKTAEACALYEGVIYRYSANWYGYLAQQRLAAMSCPAQTSPLDAEVTKAIANLKTVTVVAETSGPKELERAEKSDQLSTIGLFDWAIDELEEAKKTVQNSPKINLALARHYRFKGDNVNALLALAKSYPDYSQMFPEEMGRDEWEIFYPHVAWEQIVAWSKNRRLDMYQVAGLIRQESVFNPRASSPANAYGLMQLLLPTARAVARKYGTASPSSVNDLFQPAMNIELGTAYMRDQLDKFGRIEYMAVAYNAGPGRVAPWRASLPMEIDEFVEAIPFKETRGYVQGVIRNSAQYRRLYDENGNFKPNVGTRPLRGEIDSKPREQFTAENPEVIIDNSDSE